MIRTLLFDLDDTLLDNDMGTFVPAYLSLFSEHTADRIAPEQLVRGLLAGTRAMIGNADPTLTLQSVFSGRFYPTLGISEDALHDDIAAFFMERYPILQGVVGQRPVARDVMAWAFNAGYEVVIATSPLFPRAAILQRLAWAGVSAEEFPYTFITSMERMHFAKPKPEYFAEILALIGRRPEEALIVGNDWRNDILPAHKVGIPAFWIASLAERPPDGTVASLAGQGDLGDFLHWARDADCLPAVIAPPASSTALLARLRAVPAAVLDALRDLTEDQWALRPAPDEWSLVEIVCHLRDTELELTQPRFERVLTEDEPFISAIDADRWAEERNYRAEDGRSALETYLAARQTSCERLASLPLAAWERPARHAIFGPTNLAELASFALEHDRIHLAQLRDTRAALSGPPVDE